MSSFLDIRFPDKIAFGARGGPGWLTTVIMLPGGHEQRVQQWSEARLRWDVEHGIKTLDEYDELLAFFYNVRGRAYGFRFRDWTDYKLEDVEIGQGDTADTDTFQLVKKYTFSGNVYTRDITRPTNDGELTIKLDGSPTSFSVDYSTGVVTLSPAPEPGVTVTASGNFDIPARFDTDDMRVSHEDYNNLNWPNIPVMELRE